MISACLILSWGNHQIAVKISGAAGVATLAYQKSLSITPYLMPLNRRARSLDRVIQRILMVTSQKALQGLMPQEKMDAGAVLQQLTLNLLLLE